MRLTREKITGKSYIDKKQTETWSWRVLKKQKNRMPDSM